jgi:hypothetical protein
MPCVQCKIRKLPERQKYNSVLSGRTRRVLPVGSPDTVGPTRTALRSELRKVMNYEEN